MVERALVLGLALMGGIVTEATLSARQTDRSTTVALKFFAELPDQDIGVNLRVLRPPRISDAERAYALATLPRQGELAPDAAERGKLTSLEPILSYHDRANMDIKVVDLPYAAIAIHQRAVVLISRRLLRLLSASELQAAMAHEIGHEYFWVEQADASRSLAPASRQALELKCDGIAALTLLALGFDVSRLSSAISKVIDYNRSLGVTTEEAGYPTLRERNFFVRTLLKMQRSGFKKEGWQTASVGK
jgi:hypothetical protein